MDRLRGCQQIVQSLSAAVHDLKANPSPDNHSAVPRSPQKDVPGRLMDLLTHLTKHNILVNCDLCSENGVEGNARAYLAVDRNLQIVLCANRLPSKDVPEALIHEAVHAFDFLSHRYDLQTPEGLARSEVRAAREAECANEWRIFRKSCVRQKAARAMQNVFPHEDCHGHVDKVLDSALADLQPWQ